MSETKTIHCDKHGEQTVPVISFGGRELEVGCPICAEEFDEMHSIKTDDVTPQQMEKAGFLKRELSYTLDTYEPVNDSQRKAVDVCKRFVGNPAVIKEGYSMLMCGVIGTGKTGLAAGVGREFIIQGKNVHYCTASQFFRDCKRTWAYGVKESEEAIIVRYGRYGVLIIDEIGRHRLEDAELRLFGDLVDVRYRNILPTVYMTNLSRDDFIKAIGAAAWDRVRARLGVVQIDGESKR